MKEHKHTETARILALEREVQRLRQEKYILEQQLNMKDSQLRLILEESPVVLTSILSDGTIELSVGKGLERLGLTAASLVGRNIDEAFETLPLVLNAIRKALRGEIQLLVFPFRPDLWLQNHYIPVRNSKGEVKRVYAISLDVSAALLKYHKHQPSIEQMPDTPGFTPSSVAIFDKDLICIFLSDKWREDFLEAGEELLNRHFYEVFPAIPERWRQIHQRSLKGYSDWAINDYFCTETGLTKYINWRSMPWYDTTGEIGGFVVLAELTYKIDNQGDKKH